MKRDAADPLPEGLWLPFFWPMYLSRLRILNYKNIREADLAFSPKINCFVGNNGMGKTNLLDAVYYLSFCKSHCNAIDSQNITHDEEFLMLEGSYERGERKVDIHCDLKRRQKKHFKCDKKEYEKLSDHIGLLPLVIISPADGALISEGSDERRKFMDGFISQYDKKYLSCLLAYNNALSQRNAMIKAENREDLLLDVLEAQMVEYGSYIFAKRSDFIEHFLPHFSEFHQIVSDGKEQVGLTYRSHLQDSLPFEEQLKATRDRDFLIGYSTKGIHKDDLDMEMGGLPIKRIGSQGQNKTYLIALKLAQFNFLKEQGGVRPILLLDDIFDKLDAQRVSRILQLLRDDRFGQVFISDTDREHLSSILEHSGCDYLLFKVEDGVVEQLMEVKR